VALIKRRATPRNAILGATHLGETHLGATQRDLAVASLPGAALRFCGPITPHSARLGFRKNRGHRGDRAIVNTP